MGGQSIASGSWVRVANVSVSVVVVDGCRSGAGRWGLKRVVLDPSRRLHKPKNGD